VLLTETSSCALSEAERSRLHELEHTVESNLATFLETGKALAEIRDSGLYREHYGSFERYLLERWGISRSRARDLMNSVDVSETLLAGPAGPEGDAPLPPDLSEKALQPLAKLSTELRCATWSLASRISEKPTHTVVSKLVRIVQTAIADGYDEPTTKPKPEQPPNTSFLRSIYKLSTISVTPQLIVCSISDPAQAQRCVAVCRAVAKHCHYIADELSEKFR